MSTAEALKGLPPGEKLRLIAELWDQLATLSIRLLPDDVAELDRRRAEIEADPSIGLSRQQMWDRVGGA